MTTISKINVLIINEFQHKNSCSNQFCNMNNAFNNCTAFFWFFDKLKFTSLHCFLQSMQNKKKSNW